MNSKKKAQIKKTATRWLAMFLAVLLLGGAVLSGVMSLFHFH